MRFLCVMVLGVCFTLLQSATFAEPQAEQAQSPSELPPLESKIAEVVRKHYPDAQIQYKDGVFRASRKTMMFTIHGRLKTGEILEKTHQVEGPNYQGFVISVSVAEGPYMGQAVIPQTIDDIYWPTYIDRPATPNGQGHYVINFSYGARLDQEFKTELFKLLPRSRELPAFE